MNLAYVAGVFVGMASVAVVITIISLLYKKKHGRKRDEYDERQEAVRGRAFKVAYFTLIFYLVLNGVITKVIGMEWAENLVGSFIGISISVAVFAIKCIMDDAYFSMKEKPITYLILFIVIGIINIGISFIHFKTAEGFVTEGLLNEKAVNLSCGILFIILAFVLGFKILHDRPKKKGNGGI